MFYFFSENTDITTEVLAKHGIFPNRLIYDLSDLEQCIPYFTEEDLCLILINGFTRVVPVRLVKILNDIGLTVGTRVNYIEALKNKVVYRDRIQTNKALKIALLTDVPVEKLNVLQMVYHLNPFESELQIYDGKLLSRVDKVLSYLQDSESYVYRFFFDSASLEDVKSQFEILGQKTRVLIQAFQTCGGNFDSVVEELQSVENAASHKIKHKEYIEKKKQRFRKAPQESVTEISFYYALVYLYMRYNICEGATVVMGSTVETVLKDSVRKPDDKIEHIREIQLFKER